MTIGLLATGDEIVHGDTLNTNGQQIAHILSSEGLPLGFHISCSDKEQDIIRSLQFLTDQHDIIISIGGLGPTTDDLTRFALAKFANEPLVKHEEALLHVRKRLEAAKVSINQGNLQQCLFPANAKILPNPNGSAVGCYFPWQNKRFFLLPGPPRECLPMFNDYVLPLLQDTLHSNKEIFKWRVFGVAESEIAQILEDALADIDCQTGYRLDTPYIEFKVRCEKPLIAQIKQIVDPIIALHSITTTELKASQQLQNVLLNLKEPITIVDEATQGLFQSLIMRPGLQNKVIFTGLEKTPVFFHVSGLIEYWEQQPITGFTQLTIHYSNPAQEGGETHEIPYRTPLVLQYAAEWLSFRLLHLINQLHQ